MPPDLKLSVSCPILLCTQFAVSCCTPPAVPSSASNNRTPRCGLVPDPSKVAPSQSISPPTKTACDIFIAPDPTLVPQPATQRGSRCRCHGQLVILDIQLLVGQSTARSMYTNTYLVSNRQWAEGSTVCCIIRANAKAHQGHHDEGSSKHARQLMWLQVLPTPKQAAERWDYTAIVSHSVFGPVSCWWPMAVYSGGGTSACRTLCSYPTATSYGIVDDFMCPGWGKCAVDWSVVCVDPIAFLQHTSVLGLSCACKKNPVAATSQGKAIANA